MRLESHASLYPIPSQIHNAICEWGNTHLGFLAFDGRLLTSSITTARTSTTTTTRLTARIIRTMPKVGRDAAGAGVITSVASVPICTRLSHYNNILQVTVRESVLTGEICPPGRGRIGVPASHSLRHCDWSSLDESWPWPTRLVLWSREVKWEQFIAKQSAKHYLK